MTAASHIAQSGLIAENFLATDFFADVYEAALPDDSFTVESINTEYRREDNATSGIHMLAPNGVGSVGISSRRTCTALGLKARAVYSTDSTPALQYQTHLNFSRACLPKFRRSAALQIQEVSRNAADRLAALGSFEQFVTAFTKNTPDQDLGNKVATFAHNVARKIPLDVKFPKVTASDDCEIILTWFKKGGRIEAIIQPDGYLTWVRSKDRRYFPGGDYSFSDTKAIFALLLSLREFYFGDHRS